MGLFAARERRALVRALSRDVRLLLPGDPGRERLLECVRLFDPRARLAAGGSISVDGVREVYLTRVSVIGPDVAAEAGVPGGMGAAVFVSATARAIPLDWPDVQRKTREHYEASVRLVNGLAVRLGGVAWPEAPVLAEPLQARVYTAGEPGAGQVLEVAARYAPGLAAYHNPTFGPVGVSTWRTPDGRFEAQHWPRGTVAALLPHEPRSVGDLFFRTNELTAARLMLSVPGNRADPGEARLLGECALELAAVMGGTCVDQLGFAVRRPGDLVFGQAGTS
jgi:hypothetical protein